MKTIAVVPALLLSSAGLCEPFQNLGFDNPSFPDFIPDPFSGGPFASTAEEWMVPGWNVNNGVGYNFTEPFINYSSLLDHDYINTWQPANPTKVPVVGTYSLGIWPYSGSRFRELPFVLKQTGDIPADAQSLRFLYAGPGDFKVYVGGAERLVHFTESRPSGDPEIPSFDYFVVDVGLFAGQTAELRFEFFSFGNYPGQDGGPFPGRPDAKFHVLDDLSFSPLPAVPEPQPWALLGTGLAALLWFSKRKE